MNDLDELREFRAELPYPERTRLTPGRSRLLSAARRPPRRRFSARRNTRPILLPATAAAAAVAVAAGLAGYALSTGSAPAAHPSAAPKRSAPPSQAVLAARVLRDASAAASRVPPKATPSPGQWIYAKTVQYEYQPEGFTSSDNWITFDGTKTAYYESPGGPFVVHTSPVTPPADNTSDPLAAFYADSTPETAYYAVASLPAAPRQLLAAVAKAAEAAGGANSVAGTPIAGHAPRNEGQLEFDYLTLLLWNAAGGVGAPPAAEAAAFRAMAAIPGVTVQQGVTDAAGAPAIGVSGDGGYDQLLLDPVSYQVIGLRQLSTGIGPKPVVPTLKQLAQLPKAEQQKILRQLKTVPPWPRKGAVLYSLAYAQVSEVSGPGVK
jgi:hypothetical protein